ncbi:MAG: hypothetical protein ACLPIX_14505 [Rhodomicrobium sp.]
MDAYLTNVLVWLGGVLSAVIGGYVTYLFTRKADREKAELMAREQQRKDDRAAYDLLIRDWYKLLDIQLAYPGLGIDVGEADVPFPPGSAECARRNTAYDLLFFIFNRAYSLKEAFASADRLGKIDTWEVWDKWANAYFRRQSIRERFAEWRGDWAPGVEGWLEAKLRQ